MELSHPGPRRTTWHVEATRPATLWMHWVPRVHDIGPLVAEALRPFGAAPRVIVVTDEEVHDLYGQLVRAVLLESGVSCDSIVLEEGEGSKSLATIASITDRLDALGVHRRKDAVLGVGGGVVTDVASFAASTYRRGVHAIRVPTTLLGLVDAGVGVKTGVNHGRHKNRLGTYQPPLATIMCPEFLHTLPARQVRNGAAEMLKMALGADAELFVLLESGALADRCTGFLEHPARDQACQDAVSGMIGQLAGNLWEYELRRPVDLGHSFGPALEMRDPSLLHGETVAWDCVLAATFAARRGWLATDHLDRVVALFAQAGLLLKADLDVTFFENE
ncbi:MAG: iron-containing alcohol dehydrogenase, partial [Nocardioides sp.]|nr:iron-containing alcohol dehydrogenase [Nocardioides sp.]